MEPFTAADVLAVIDSTAEHLPDLRVVVVTTNLGYEWAIDPDSSEVWVQGDVTPTQWCGSVIEALSALCLHHHIPQPGGRRLRLLPAVPARMEATTGTHGR